MITVDSLVEVKIAEEEDFLKIKETLTRIGVASRKDQNYINLAIFCISKASIISYTLRNCLRLMASHLTSLMKTRVAAIQSYSCLLSGVLLKLLKKTVSKNQKLL